MQFLNWRKTFFASTAAGRPRAVYCLFLLLMTVLVTGCQKTTYRVDDPKLKPIQEMIESELPMGSSTDRVTNFLSARGYELQAADKPGTLVALIRHIDTQTVRPVTARVTFFFDANGRLNAVEMTRTMNQPVPQ
jgi:hypothetical protein